MTSEKKLTPLERAVRRIKRIAWMKQRHELVRLRRRFPEVDWGHEDRARAGWRPDRRQGQGRGRRARARA